MELKPCPFCGSKQIDKKISIQYDESGLNEAKNFYSCVCPMCGCRTALFNSEYSALIAWNRRANDV